MERPGEAPGNGRMRRFQTALRPRSGVGTLLVAALALLAVLVLGGAWVHLGPTHSLHPQLARAPGALSLAAHAVAATAATASGGGGGADLDAAIEARLPRYWAELLRICPNMTYRPYSCFPPHQRTSLAHSQLEPLPSFRGLGRWHVLRLLTATPDGARKAEGGDTLWAVLHDNATQRRLPVRVLDEGDGSYSLAFVALAPGNYTLVLRLYYTLCAGLQDPPDGYEKALEHSGAEAHCYEGQKRVFDASPVAIPAGTDFSPIPAAAGGDGQDPGGASAMPAAAAAASHAAEGLLERLPAPVLRADHYVYRAGPLATGAGPQRLLFWGDSTIKRTFMLLVALARYPCTFKAGVWRHRLHLEDWNKEFCNPVPSGQADPRLELVLQRCTAGAAWATVPLGANYPPHVNEFPHQMDCINMTAFSYNDTHAKLLGAHPVPREFTVVYEDGWGMRPVKFIAADTVHWRPGDAVVFNIGAHAVRMLSFDAWRRYIDQLAPLLANATQRAPVVWRTTIPIREDAFRDRNGTTYFSAGHFQNEARRVLFDSYAEWRLRAAGLWVWDITAYAGAGAHGPRDMFHLDGKTMRDLNLDMAEQMMC